MFPHCYVASGRKRDVPMRWVHESLVEGTVTAFCAAEIPDAGDWSESEYDIRYEVLAEPDTEAWRVEVDVPTSAQDAWLDFRIVERRGIEGATVEDVHCVRSGRGEREAETYVWSEAAGEWELFRDGEGDDAV